MGLFNSADTGRFPYKTGFNMSYEKDMDIDIGKLNIINSEFICPGDIVHVSENVLLRFQAQFAPFFTTLVATVRNWFIPLRLVEDNTEWVITGSKNGKLMKDEHGAEVAIPTFDKLFDYEKAAVTGSYKIKTGGIVEQMFGLPNKKWDSLTSAWVDLDYSTIKNNRVIPALYWIKAYYRMWFDYYRDENLFDYEDFDDWWTAILADGKIGQQDLLPVNWKKDYLTSMLYSQQKGIAPVLNPFINNPQLTLPITVIDSKYTFDGTNGYSFKDSTGIAKSTDKLFGVVANDINGVAHLGSIGENANLNAQQAVLDTGALRNVQGGFNASELRLLFAQQKIFERLMRCGSRYVEYLMSNFGTAPADETLQRVQYLGGFKQGIVTSEVLQTAADGSTPVGTQRGHTISAGGNSLGRYHFKEFGIMLTTLSVMPRATYTQGVNRKYCLTERFDFPNPSFQFMSEDEVLNGEVYIDTDVDESGNFLNDKTMGFQEMYAWLKSNRDMVTGNLRGDQKYWVMPREFKERPLLNERFLTSSHDQGNFAMPFAVTDKPPIIMRAGNIVHMWRNFARYGTPGLLDHY